MDSQRGLKIAVIGTGKMGRGIAAACATHGHEVMLISRSAERAEALARAFAASDCGHGQIKVATFAPESVANADIVIESVVEDETIKGRLFAQLEKFLPPSSVLATNTSSLSVTRMQSQLSQRDRFVGLHFLLPAESTYVVEIVSGTYTSSETQLFCQRLVSSLDKVAIRVTKEQPGFVWNRLQFAVLREALFLAEEGIASPLDIERALSLGLAPRWLAAGAFATAELGGTQLFLELARRVFPTLCDWQAPRDPLPAASPDQSGELTGLGEQRLVELEGMRRWFLSTLKDTLIGAHQERGLLFDGLK